MSPSVEPTSSETDVCVQETLSLIFWILQCLDLIALSQALLIPTQSSSSTVDHEYDSRLKDISWYMFTKN